MLDHVTPPLSTFGGSIWALPARRNPAYAKGMPLGLLGFQCGPPLLHRQNTELFQGPPLVGRLPGTRPGFPLAFSQESGPHSRNSHLGAPLWGWQPVVPADPMVIFPQASHPDILKHLLVEECTMRSLWLPPG